MQKLDIGEIMGEMGGRVVRAPSVIPKAIPAVSIVGVFHYDQETNSGLWALELGALADENILNKKLITQLKKELSKFKISEILEETRH